MAVAKPKPGNNNLGGYQVYVASDGAIEVKPGDSLSKYSMAMYGDFEHIHEFVRSVRPLQNIDDVDYIQAGWTIYHLPTATVESGNGQPATPISESAIREEVERTLRDDYGFHGDLLTQTTDFISNRLFENRILSGIGSIGVIPAEVAGILGPVVALELATLFGVVAAILAPIAGVLAFWKNRSFNIRQNGVRGVAYGMVAWHFEDPKPELPQKIRFNLRQSGVGDDEIQQSIDSFAMGVNQTFDALNINPPPHGRTIEQQKSFIRTTCGQNRKRLGTIIMEELAKREFSYQVERQNFLWAMGVEPYEPPPLINTDYPETHR